MIWNVTEYALWEISSLLGFVGFIQSGSVMFFGACIVFTLMGFAYSFPRWSRWTALVTELGLVTDPDALDLA